MSLALSLLEVFSLPLLGAASLLGSKLLIGTAAEAAQRWFVGILIAVALITCRTVIVQDDCWLAHTTTLAMMFLGALLLPDRQTLAERRGGEVAKVMF